MFSIRRLAAAAVFAALWIPACAANPPPPAGGPPGGGQPPQEAIDACNGLKENDACTIKSDKGEMKGTCAKSPEDKVACHPEGGPGGHHGPPPGAPPADSTR